MTARTIIVKLLQKTRLNRVAHRLYYRYLHGFDTASRDVLPALQTCFQKSVESRTAYEGDYCEFGIFKGYAFWYAQDTAAKLGLDGLRFYGFDSFRGLPKVQGRDATANDAFYEGQFSCTKDRVTENLERAGVDWNRTFLIEGFFGESLNETTKNELEMRKIAIALIDCDLYASTIDVLHFISDMIIDGTILLFDDWNCFDRNDERGQRRAFREFRDRHPRLAVEDLFTYGAYGQVFMLRKPH
ncbi:MAG: hypothetical protein H0W33_04805 [Gammaproteobacteria bacterium]|nr:hypothetical protein [Gammaproteobacteria bacterium]